MASMGGFRRAWLLCLCLCLWLPLSGAQSSTPVPSSPAQQNTGGQELGPCICDLTRASCDINCCCDPDCTALGLVAGFDCLPAGPANRTAHSCHSKGYLHNVNPRVNFWVVADDLQGLLCVAVDNNVIKGVFHNNPTEVSPARVDSERANQQKSSFGQLLTAAGPNSKRRIATENRGYQGGDLLKVHRAISQVDNSIIPLPMQLDQLGAFEVVSTMPSSFPDVLGECAASHGNAVRFLIDLPRTSCWQGPLNLASTCETLLNYRSANAWSLRKMHLPEAERCGTRCMQPKVSCPLNVTSVSGEAIRTSPCAAGEELSGRAARFVQDGASCSCFDALRELQYTINYGFDANEGGVVIKSVGVEVTLQNIRSDNCQPVRVPQYMSVRFLQEGSDLQEVSRSHSGRPGYRVGLPLLAGTCKRYDTAENCVSFDTSPALSPFATVRGIRPDGRCVLQSDSTVGKDMEVRFGEDAVFGCSVPYSRQELASICRAGAPTGFMDLLRLLPFGRLGGGWTHLAAFGELQNVEAMDWIDVVAMQGSKSLEFEESQNSKASTSTCRNAVVGVSLEILYSPFGEVRNPQARIVGARQSHTSGNLHYEQRDPTKLQDFQFTFTVSFVRVDDIGTQEADYPPRPQIPLWLPHDLFYPFGLGRSSGMTVHCSPAALMLVCAALWLS